MEVQVPSPINGNRALIEQVAGANATGTGAATAVYTPISTTAGTTIYRVLVNASNSGCNQAVSNNATAIITPDLTITTQPVGFNECVGGNVALSVVAANRLLTH